MEPNNEEISFGCFSKRLAGTRLHESVKLQKEIEFLNRSPYTKLAMKENEIVARLTNKRDSLLLLYNRGRKLVGQGWTFDMIEEDIDDAQD